MLIDNFHHSPGRDCFLCGHYSSLNSCWDKALAVNRMESFFSLEKEPEVIRAVAADSSTSSSSHARVPELDESSTNPLEALSQCVDNMSTDFLPTTGYAEFFFISLNFNKYSVAIRNMCLDF